MERATSTSRAEEAVQRSLQRRQAAAEAEVARLISTGRELLGSGAEPRVADIVKAADVSIEAFYRYFGSKSEFVAAVAEDGARRVTTYITRKMEGIEDPAARFRAAIRALMSQAARPDLATAARNILGHTRESAGGSVFRTELAELLAPTLAELGSADVERDARVAATTLVGILEDHVWGETTPTRPDIDHLAGYLARAVGSTPID